MRFVQRMLGRSRVRALRQELAESPSPALYVQLARECAALGMVREARRACEEGLAAFPGSAELKRMRTRATRLEREARLRELREELREAPRPALWRETCEILLETGQVSRAIDVASEWLAATDDDEARVVQARALVERFVADRGREAGQAAFEALAALEERLPADARPWELHLELTTHIGAWREARRATARLLGLRPGDPELEARFRTLDAMSDDAPSVHKALLEVERTGRLASELDTASARKGWSADVRPALRRLAEDPAVRAAFYVRGGTALVQGARGATAERSARAVRSILQSSRTTARRLGLGQVHRVQLEGGFGTLALAPGEMDAGALWCGGPLSFESERGLMDLAGLEAVDTGDPDEGEGEAA